jgi:endo-1,4-beta-xylanase
MVSRYKNKVKAWDVINEMFTESGEIRNESNSPDPNWFVWSHYLGRDFGVKAFNYAKAADPTADLFINDYNLETSSAKLDSLIKYVAEIRTKGAKVDGIGTQMHINWNTSMVGIEEMFRKLGATGLKIRITELDIATLLGGNAKSPTPQLLAYQAQMAKNVVESYLRNVPKAQRAGITIWGLHDSSSWRYNNGAEFPLFYNNDFTKKPAYSAFLQALKGQ